MLVITHVDDQQLDEAGEQTVAQVSTESVPVTQIRSVVLSYVYAQPQDYKPSDPVRELTLSIAWSGGQRLDMGPASCGDPQCEADHGYSGTIAQEDIVLRISAEADGLQAVQDAKLFARALRAVNTGSSAPVPAQRARAAAPTADGRVRKPPQPRPPALRWRMSVSLSPPKISCQSRYRLPPWPPTPPPSRWPPAPAVPAPAAPAFGHRSIAEVLTSAAASLGVPASRTD